ncbi:MAG: hypothetical protein QOJ40_1309 [Verrucomicrobiota bacterium]
MTAPVSGQSNGPQHGGHTEAAALVALSRPILKSENIQRPGVDCGDFPFLN